MAKRRIMPGGLGAPGDMWRRLQTLQEDLMKAQEEIAAMTVTATAGGGAVTAVISGDRRLKSLQIQPDVVDPNDVEMLQDLIVAAVNQGLEQAEKVAAERMSAVTGGLGLDLGL
jgi:DNA-binding YbaB/EbfC family protein